MAHYAQVNEHNIVTQVTKVDDVNEPTEEAGSNYCNSLFGGRWIKTSYNTHNNVHYGEDGRPDGKPAVRGNYAGIGYIYDPTNDVFYPTKPYPSWTLNTSTWQWDPPVPYPVENAPSTDQGNFYLWNEIAQKWVQWA